MITYRRAVISLACDTSV